MRILSLMSSSTDDVRLAVVRNGDLLRKLYAILDEEPGIYEAKQYACNILQGLLSDEGEDDDVLDAFQEVDFVPTMAKYMGYELLLFVLANYLTSMSCRHIYTSKALGAQVLSQLIWIFDGQTPEETVSTAISLLDEFCAVGPENVEEIVSIIVSQTLSSFASPDKPPV